MVLHDERAVKAQCLSLDVVFDEVVVALRAVELTAASPCLGAAEQSELHETPFVELAFPRTTKV
jgi:hypothetical protein